MVKMLDISDVVVVRFGMLLLAGLAGLRCGLKWKSGIGVTDCFYRILGLDALAVKPVLMTIQ